MSEQVVDTGWPDVDVVMPIRNEAADLAAAIGAVRAQVYPGTVRIFLGVGPSNDDTEQIAAQLAEHDDNLVVVENPSGLTPSALNLAIRSGSAPVIVRVDGHSHLSGGYIAVGRRDHAAHRCRQRRWAAGSGGDDTVRAGGGRRYHVVARHRRASYRVGGEAGPVDTVFLGVFDRAAVEDVGLFDEHLVRNQDYELNIRLRKAGGTVWFDPELSRRLPATRAVASTRQAVLRIRPVEGRVVMRMHPDSTRIGQLAPPVAVLGTALCVACLTALAAVRRHPRCCGSRRRWGGREDRQEDADLAGCRCSQSSVTIPGHLVPRARFRRSSAP